MERLHHYFPALPPPVVTQLEALAPLYAEWNSMINVISRKDIDQLYERHVLHSLAIHRFLPFQPDSRILDIGTGGGFPGIPLAIVQPEVKFVLTDSIGKKIKVVKGIVESLGLKNVEVIHARAESVAGPFDFAVSRAVAPLPELIAWCRPLISNNHRNALPNGLICLKGGDIREEVKSSGEKAEVYELKSWFTEPYFDEKKLIYIAF